MIKSPGISTVAVVSGLGKGGAKKVDLYWDGEPVPQQIGRTAEADLIGLNFRVTC
jgi:hypothetical protein